MTQNLTKPRRGKQYGFGKKKVAIQNLIKVDASRFSSRTGRKTVTRRDFCNFGSRNKFVPHERLDKITMTG